MARITKCSIVENYVLNKIQNGELKIGDQIETEKQISEKLDIGALTVSKALSRLSQMGYIKRIAGKGSFVTSTVIVRDTLHSSTFLEDLQARGIKSGSKLLDYKIIKASAAPKIASKLNLKDDDIIHFFKRLRTGNDIPMGVIYSYVSAKVVPALDVLVLSRSDFSLKHYLNDIGITCAGTQSVLSSTLSTPELEEILRIENCALLKNVQMHYNSEQVPYLYNETYFVGTRYCFTFSDGIMRGTSFPDAFDITDLDLPLLSPSENFTKK